MKIFKIAAIIAIGTACVQCPAWAQQRAPQPQPAPQRPARPEQEKSPKPEKPPRIVTVQNPDITIERLRKLFKLTDNQVFKLRPLVQQRNQDLAQVQEQNGTAASRKADSQSLQDRFQS